MYIRKLNISILVLSTLSFVSPPILSWCIIPVSPTPTTIIKGDEVFDKGACEHISFHNDGTVHFKHKRYKKKIGKYYDQIEKLGDSIFKLGKKPSVFPLLIDSVFFGYDNCQLKEKNHNPNEGCIFSINRKHHFSIMLFLIHESINPINFFKSNSLMHIVYNTSTPKLIKAYNGYSIMVIFSSRYVVQGKEDMLTAKSHNLSNLQRGLSPMPQWDSFKK